MRFRHQLTKSFTSPTGSPLSETHSRCGEEYHNAMQASVKVVSRHAIKTIDPPRKTPCVLWAGRYVSLRGYDAFAPFYARMPPPFGRIRKEPFSGKGFLTPAFLWYLSFAGAKESTKNLNQKKSAKNLNQKKIQNNFNQTQPLQKLIFPTPNLN